jgi:hypothetical protein
MRTARRRTAPRRVTSRGILARRQQTAEVYKSVVEALVAAVMDGFNATVFAYGQTSSGKARARGAVRRSAFQRQSPPALPLSSRACLD